MSRNIKQSLIALTALLSLAGCDPKDPIYDTPYPEQGTITLTTDWSKIGEGLTMPESYTVAAAGYTGTLSGTVNRLDYLFPPSEIRVNVYNTAEHISINGTTATVATASGNAGDVGPFIQNTPGWLFASTAEMMIEKDKEHSHTAVMQQQVRQLTLIIQPTGETTDRIVGIEGWLTGAASSLNFADGTHGTPSNAALTFTEIASGANAGKWAATVRLLGTAGGEQKLSAQIRFAGGTPSAVNLESDLTTELAAFNDDKRTPLTLGGRMVETPTGMGFEATIEQWEAVEPVEGEATLPEPEPARIGDYFYSDGSYSTELNPNKTVIGIVFQTDPERIGVAEKEVLKAKRAVPRGLVMAVKNAGRDLTWGPQSDEDLYDCVTKEDNDNDFSGYGNCEHIRQIYGSFENYPAFKAADEYNKTCPAPESTTGWYLPASGQWYDILRNLGGLADWDAAQGDDDYDWLDPQLDVLAALNSRLSDVADADKFNNTTGTFWSSSEYSEENVRVWGVLHGSVICWWYAKYSQFAVRPVLAF